MSDSVDEANDLQDLLTTMAVEAQRKLAQQHSKTLQACTGACLNCEEKLDGGRFCDSDCRDDFEKRLNARRRQ
jgi:hypothetical protein